jgi:predicted RNase H-related nuclease YkuK (DUF458 family)
MCDRSIDPVVRLRSLPVEITELRRQLMMEVAASENFSRQLEEALKIRQMILSGSLSLSQ